MSATGEQSERQLVDQYLDVAIDVYENVNRLPCASNDSSKSQPVDHSLDPTIFMQGNVGKSACASDESSKNQPVYRILETTITSQRNSSRSTFLLSESSQNQPASCTEATTASHESGNDLNCALHHKLKARIVRPTNSIRSTCSQVVATLIQNWLLIDIGMELTMPTLVLGALHRNPAEKLCMNDDQASWFGSLLYFLHPLGGLISGYLQERFGRKGSMLLVNIAILAAWVILYFANSIYTLYAVSLVLGLCCGLSEAPLHSYIGEIGEPNLRGTLATLSTSFVSVGYIFTYFLGYLVHWRTAALIACSVPVITFLCMTQIPESPIWLIKQHRLKDAQESLSWLRGWVKPSDVHEEFQDLVEYTKNSSNQSGVESKETAENGHGDSSVNKKDGYLKIKFREVTDKKVLLPLRLVFIAFAIQNVASLQPLKPYIVGILGQFGFPFNRMLILILSSLSFFLGALMNMTLLRRYGKRKITLFSHGLVTASILLLGVYCSFLRKSNLLPILVWIPMILFINVDLCCGFCVGLLPFQLVCEVFPLKGRGFASGLSAAWAFTIAFIMSKLYLYLEVWIKLSGVMYLYGSISFLGVLYHYFYLPETEGKSLEQIETYFTKDHDPREKFSIAKKEGWAGSGKQGNTSLLQAAPTASEGIPNPGPCRAERQSLLLN